jgi:aminoglycoside phosphotransferase (APT) family kinase protein
LNPNKATKHLLVFCSADGGLSWKEDLARTDVKRGAFTTQEKDAAKKAATDYAVAHNLRTDDWSWLLALRAEGQAGMITRVATALPHRTRKSIWAFLTRALHSGNYKVSGSGRT